MQLEAEQKAAREAAEAQRAQDLEYAQSWQCYQLSMELVQGGLCCLQAHESKCTAAAAACACMPAKHICPWQSKPALQALRARRACDGKRCQLQLCLSSVTRLCFAAGSELAAAPLRAANPAD